MVFELIPYLTRSESENDITNIIKFYLNYISIVNMIKNNLRIQEKLPIFYQTVNF